MKLLKRLKKEFIFWFFEKIGTRDYRYEFYGYGPADFEVVPIWVIKFKFFGKKYYFEKEV